MHQQRVQDLNLDEEIAQDESYYARRWGYDCHQHNVTTQDGYILKMYRFAQKRKIPCAAGNSERRKSVLIGHGLFQCSGNLVLNEKDSLVFALVDEGYDVWTGNNRAVGSLEHTCLSSEDDSYWEWGLKELALYDFPAMLEYIYEATGQEKASQSHSQGNAQVFIALSLQPELANKMSCFIALAPAVVSGALVTTYPLRALIHMNKKVFRLLFGKKAFLEIMTTAQQYLPPSLMCTLAYSVFSYLFTWWDSHWVQRRKIKYFQFTPRPVSTRLILDWLEGWGRQGVCLHVTNTINQNNNSNNVFERIPLAIIYGENDYLVDSAAFVRSFKGYENHGLMEEKGSRPSHQHQQHGLPPSSTSTETQHSFSFPSLELVHVERIPAYEHMDPIWAHDSRFTTNPVIYDVLKKAKWKTDRL
ncbi:Alpha/Beta hydrolase protein [Absidia repens]|uniref:Alpha/Beta hydrolase protein n=1 Tax=Absidia repens TaxID=90262 RepID=A0A1X2IC43_9FUNG|nr:Alpha/Beta hydrolase protein [Absidia repens]